MAFVPRTFTQIITDMIAYVQDRTGVTDFTVGSVVRTLLEAASLEDDEQYFQMVQLLDIFSYVNASGEDLDRRLADFNIFRAPSNSAFGKISFVNNKLTVDAAAVDVTAGNTILQIFDSSGFPSSGSIRVGEGTSRVQDLNYSGLDTSLNQFTISTAGGVAIGIRVGDSVSLVSGSSMTFAPGTTILAPATATENSKTFSTTETATLVVGNRYSNQVTAVATTPGPGGNAGSGRITQFEGTPPYTGTSVTNFSSITGGVSRESDQDFRARAVEKLQSLARGTVLSLKSYSVGVSDPSTGQRVISSNVFEDFVSDPEEVIVYVDDGTGLVPDRLNMGQSALAAFVSIGTIAIQVSDGSVFPTTGFVIVGDDFLAEYESVLGNLITLTEPTTITSDPGEIVRRVDVVSEAAEPGQRRFSLQNPPIVRNSIRIYIKDPGVATWELLVEGTDYILNKGTGEFSIVSNNGLAENTQVVANYSYYTNLVAQVQKVLEGNPNDSVNFPGVKAAGVFLAVEAPVFKRVTVRVTISAENTFVESILAPLVKQEIETYISSLKIGEDVITSRIVDVAHNVTGVRSVTVQLPLGNITVLENELPVFFDTSQTSLVTVL